MAFSITPIAAKDSGGIVIPGGVDFVDVSGTGAGPHIITKVNIDPAGANTQGVLSNSAAKTDLSSISGTTADTNSGTKSAGTQRVVIATDQPQLTNALKVDGSAVTQPVSLTSTTLTGTVAATQSGTWTVQPGNTANTTAWKVDGSAATQPVSGTVTANAGTGTLAVSLASVPSHAVTNVGTFAAQAAQSGTWTVQPGNTANTTAWKVDGSAVTQPVSGTVTTTPPSNASTNVAQINAVTPLMGNGVTGTGSQRVTIASDNTAFAVNSTLAAETTKVIGVVRNADGSGNLTTSTSQALDVNIKSATGTGGTNIPVQLTNLNAATLDGNSGTKSNGTLRVVLATDQPVLTNKILVTPDSVALPANQSVNVAQVNGVTTLMGNGVTGTGSQRVTIASDNTAFSTNAAQSGTWTVQPGNTANTTAWLTQSQATTGAGGIPTTYRLLSAAGTSGDATNVKASAGRVYAIQGANVRTSAVYLKLYNSASAPTAGSGTPVKTLYIPPSCAFVFDWPTLGYSFSTGIGFTLVTGSADNSSTSVSAGDILALNIDYAQ